MEENKALWYVGSIFPLPIIYCNRKKICTMSRDLTIELREEYARLIVDAVNAATSTQKNELVIPHVSHLVCMCHGTKQVSMINNKYICCTCNRPLF